MEEFKGQRAWPEHHLPTASSFNFHSYGRKWDQMLQRWKGRRRSVVDAVFKGTDKARECCLAGPVGPVVHWENWKLQSLVGPESNDTSATAGERPVTGGLRCELDIHQLRITPPRLNEVTHRHRLCPFVSKERLKCARWVLLRAGMASHSFYCKT